MASTIEGLVNGKLLQILFSEGVRNQLSRDVRDFDMIKLMKVDDAKGRSLRYMIQDSYGAAAIQYRNASSSINFPSAQKVSTQELEAEYKEIDMTIEFDYNLWNRLQKSKDVRYFDILALELQSKVDAAKRRFGADLYSDGLGVIGTVSTATDTTGAGGSVSIVLSSADTARGHIGWFEAKDLLLNYNAVGTIDSPTVVGTFYAWRVKSRNRRLNTVVLEAIDTTGTVLSLTASSIDATDVLYRVGQPTIVDLTAPVSDYGFATEVITGLETLSANDGRVVNGLTMSGFTGGSRFDAGNVQLDVSHIQACLDDAKIAAGEGAYSYKRMIMAPEAHAALIESRETDRRFNSVEDNKRGVRFFAFQHRNDSLETYSSEYVPKKRIYMMPENKATKDKVVEFYGSDFEPVKVNDSSAFMLKSGSNGYERKIQHFMEAYAQLVVKHPAAIAVVQNFTLA